MVEQLYADFIAFLDSLYYEGYAEQLAHDNPEFFTLEFNNYLDQYLPR